MARVRLYRPHSTRPAPEALLTPPAAPPTQGLSCYVLLLEEAAGPVGRVPAREVETHLLAVGLVRVRVRVRSVF